VRLVRFLVGAGAAAAAAYYVASRVRESSAAMTWPADGDDWYPSLSEVASARSETAATVHPVVDGLGLDDEEDLLTSAQAAPEPLETGRFSMRGWAAAAGHAVVSGVTFNRRLPEEVAAEQIVIEVDATDNVPRSGLLILRDGGFAPSREGFALMLAAAGPGPFSAAGSYRVFRRG
jgi:hypothetical protein